MKTIRFSEMTRDDGSLTLTIPVGAPKQEFDVLVVLQPKTSHKQDWPPGYFENTYGSIDDESFCRHEQGKIPDPVEWDQLD